MAAPRSSVLLYRNLLKELKLVYKKTDSPAVVFVKDQFRSFQVTSEKVCRGQQDVNHTGETYLCLLQSLREYEKLQERYKGQERDLETCANIVGLTLPKAYNPDSTQPSK